MIGNFTGADRTAAVAAVGATSPLIGLIVNLFIGIALGTNVVIANAVGQGNKEEVGKAVHTSVLLALLGGFAVACVGELLAEPLLGLLNVPGDVFPLALLYLRIYLAGMPVILLYTRRNNSNFRCYCKYGISKSGNYRCKRSFYIYHCSK